MFSFSKQMKDYLTMIYDKLPALDIPCERCGRCCNKQVSMAFIEFLNIKNFILDDKIKVLDENNGNCIFLKNEKQAICSIYEVRPWICRVYRPLSKDSKAYYLDLKKERTTEKCGYCIVEVKDGKTVPADNISIAMMIDEMQQIFATLLSVPDRFLHKDNTFFGWKEECKKFVRDKVKR